MTRFFTWDRILYMFYVNGATFTLFQQDYILAGSRSRVSEAVTLSHCALHMIHGEHNIVMQVLRDSHGWG